MFGHDDDNQQSNDQSSATPVISPAPDELVTPDAETHDDALPASSAPAFDSSAVSLDSPSLATTAPAHDDDSPAPSAPPAGDDSSDDDILSNSDTANAKDDLVHIKLDALHELSPLVDHLDQTPEEKFKTTMMMIQASDDQSLVKTAYEAAKAIKDDKVRAQALLDIINEINYFTQQATA